ncbi:MAG: hypothetical protein R3B90_03520 [Planctomycetaceae bacterium]
MSSPINHRFVWSALAAASIAYCAAVLLFVATSPTVRIASLPGDYVEFGDEGSQLDGVMILSTDGLGPCSGNTPEPGDVLISLAGERTRTFVDLARAVRGLRDRRIQPGATLVAGENPSELPEFREATSEVSLVEIDQQGKLAKVTLLREGIDEPIVGWVPLQPQSLAGLIWSIAWFVLQAGVVLVVAIAYWHRPFDPALRTFLAVSMVAMCAFVAGSHWWAIAAHVPFLMIFVTTSLLLPAALLNFFLVYPVPRRWLTQRPQLALGAVYFLPVVACCVSATGIATASWLSFDSGGNPLGTVVKSFGATIIRGFLPWLRAGTLAYLVLAAIYFVISIAILVRTDREYRDRREHPQIRSILWAAIAAALPLSYALVRAMLDPVGIAYGGARHLCCWPACCSSPPTPLASFAIA